MWQELRELTSTAVLVILLFFLVLSVLIGINAVKVRHELDIALDIKYGIAHHDAVTGEVVYNKLPESK